MSSPLGKYLHKLVERYFASPFRESALSIPNKQSKHIYIQDSEEKIRAWAAGSTQHIPVNSLFGFKNLFFNLVLPQKITFLKEYFTRVIRNKKKTKFCYPDIVFFSSPKRLFFLKGTNNMVYIHFHPVYIPESRPASFFQSVFD